MSRQRLRRNSSRSSGEFVDSDGASYDVQMIFVDTDGNQYSVLKLFVDTDTTEYTVDDN